MKILPRLICLNPTTHSTRIPLRDLGNLGEGADQRDQTNCPAQVPTEAPPHMARTPQAIGNYELGARLPGSFTGGTEPIEDSPLTERNTPTTNNPGGNIPAREISSAVTGLTALEAMRAISDHPASAVPMSRNQVLAKIQRYLLEIEQQWLEYDEGTSPSDNWGMHLVGNHHAEQIRRVRQVLEGVEDGSDLLASNMIKRESPQGYDLGEQVPHFNNQGKHLLAQELMDMQRHQGQDQQDDHHRDYGLAPNRENRPAYLSGREKDIMAYLYGDQVSEMAHRVKRHARHYQSQRRQGGGGGGEPNGEDDLHGDDDNGRNEQPDNGRSGGGPPSGNRNGPFLGRGG